jgi:glutaredoxin 3
MENWIITRMTTVEIYATAICPYCVAAKNLLKSKGLDYAEIRIDTDAARFKEMLERSGGRRSVPQIFINNAHIGGYDDLVAADRSGKLAQVLGGGA